MYAFHVTVHARPENVADGDALAAAGDSYRTLRVDPRSLSAPMGTSFEEAVRTLAALPRMFVEPDGSFVWVSPRGAEPAWQVDGNLADRQGRLLLVDLKGRCPAEPFDRLLAAFGWPATPLVFQLVREAVFLDEAEFRRLAEKTGS
jgi:hypothetical protein